MEHVYVWLIRLLCCRILFKASEGCRYKYHRHTSWAKKDETDKIYMVGAYYDRLALYDRHDKHGPPVFSNGAGVVGMLETARILVKSGNKHNTLLFVAFDYHLVEDWISAYEPCCRGEKFFVSEWLPTYLQNRRSNGSIVEFGGAILLESVLNHNPNEMAQSLPDEAIARRVFHELYEDIYKDRQRGEFLLIVGRTLDSNLHERYRLMWDIVMSQTPTWGDVVDATRLKLYLVEIELAYSNDVLYKYIEQNVLETSLFHFYRNHYKAVLITDTGPHRGYSLCDECGVLTKDRIEFLEKTIYSVVYTIETMAFGKYAEDIMSQIRFVDKSPNKATTISTLRECPTEMYEYATELDLYYKLYKGLRNTINWNEAKTRCEDEGSQLLIIHDYKDMQYLKNLGDYYYWVGANDREEEGVWKWTDGSNVTSDLWKNCQPDDASIGEDCAVISEYSKMVDINCESNSLNFICACQVNKNVTEYNEDECFVDDYVHIEEFDLYYKIYQEDSEVATQLNAMEVCRNNNASLFEAFSFDEFIWFYEMFSDFTKRDYYINSSLEMRNLYQDKTNDKAAENMCTVLIKEDGGIALSLRDCDTKLPFICGRLCKRSQIIEIKQQAWKGYDYSETWTYVQNNDGHFGSQFIITTEKSILLAEARSPVSLDILKEIETNEHTYSVDFHFKEKMVYWHRRSSTHIMMKTFDHNFPSRPIVKTNDPFTYIAFDWLTKYVFWSCMDRQIISVTDVYRNKSMILYMTGLNKPRSIEIDPVQGVIFWIEIDGIKSAPMVVRYANNRIELALPGEFDQLSTDVYTQFLYVSNGNKITKYFYHEKKIDVRDFDAIECFDMQVSFKTLDVKITNIQYQTDVYATCSQDCLSQILIASHNLIIGYFHFFRHHRESVFYIQSILKLKENIHSLKLIDERKVPYSEYEQRPCPGYYLLDRVEFPPCDVFCLPLEQDAFECVCPLDGARLSADVGICGCENGHIPCLNGVECVDIEKLCDGKNDCSDGSDELHCGCAYGQIPCLNGIGCVDIEKLCDFKLDCLDWSDENRCGCENGHISCLNGVECVDIEKLCDGKNDCFDGSDEHYCGCAYGQIPCLNGIECVDIGKLCDFKQDCLDLSDEYRCARKREQNITHITCPSCDHTICSVLNYNGGCEQLCHPLDQYPHRYCDCFEGYHLLSETICSNENDTVHVLFYTNNEQIMKATPVGDGVSRQQLDLRDSNVYEEGGITIDPIETVLYWIVKKGDGFVIKGGYINGSGFFDVFEDLFEPRSPAVDVIGRQIYVSLVRNSTIDSITIDELLHACVYILKGDGCYANSIQLDSFNMYIYYTQICETSNIDIIRVNIVTKSISVIVKDLTDTAFKTVFSVDIRRDHIYWTTGVFQSSIEYQAIYGTESGTLVDERQLIQYSGIIIIGDYMFMTGNQGQLTSVNLTAKEGILYPLDNNLPITSVTGYSFSYSQGHVQSDACPSIAKCLGFNLRWICLSPENVCDGTEDCYNYYDEMHCGYSDKHYTTINIELTCFHTLTMHKYSYDNTTLSFVNWDTHPFSIFIDISHIQNYECDVVYGVSNLELSQSFKLYSFHIYHRFRQIIASDVLRDTNSLQRFRVSGLGIYKSWTDQSLMGFDGLLHLSFSHIHMPVIVNNIFKHLSKLLTLDIKIFTLQQIESSAFNGIVSCQNITISETQIKSFPDKLFHNLTNLLILDISYNKLILVKQNTFEDLIALKIIDFRGNDFHFTGKLFVNNVNLQIIYSSVFSVCCVKPVHMPDENCISPPDYFSSCEHLVENIVLRLFLWMVGILALFGNIVALISRIKSEDGLSNDTFSILIANLTFSDSLMGLYLISIASVDQYYRGIYMWNDYEWRKSLLCSVLGILCSVSTETSIFSISFITIARYIAVKYLFREHRVSRKDAVIASIVFWLISLAMALCPYFAFEGYYTSSGVCVSLPLIKGTSAGWLYSFSLFIVFNFITFLFIASAQVLIIEKVRQQTSEIEIQSTGLRKHIEVAKRVTPIIVTDCMCWIPIGVMGIMAISGYDMPKTVYAWTVVFVLPINSALNPLLYTFDAWMRKIFAKIFEIMKRFFQGYGKYAFMCLLVYMLSATVIMLMHQVYRISEIVKDHEEVYKPEQHQLMRDQIMKLYSLNSGLQKKFMNLTEVLAELEAEPCDDYLVFGSKKNDVRLSVSSSTVNKESITNGSIIQLVFDIKDQTFSCAWIPSFQDGYQYLQMKFYDDKKINGIAFQGGLDSHENGPCYGYVTSIRVFHSFNCKDWKLVPITAKNINKKMEANPTTTITTVNFENTIRTRCVRLNPVNWKKRIAMRADIIGC